MTASSLIQHVPLYPSRVDQKLKIYDVSLTTCLYGPFGKLLATGSSDGDLFIWDMTLRGIRLAVKLNHNQAIRQIAWSSLGSKLLTMSKDFITFHVLDEALQLQSFLTITHSLPENSTWTKVHFHPVSSNVFIASSQSGFPTIYKFDPATKSISSEVVSFSLSPADLPSGFESTTPTFPPPRNLIAIFTGSSMESIDSAYNMIVGDSLGNLYNVCKKPGDSSATCIGFSRALAACTFKDLSTNSAGNLLLANCSDKIIRLYRLDEQVFVPTGANGQCSSIENSEVTDHASGVMKSPKLGSASFCVKFADTVSKCGWNKALITPNALFIVATAALKDSHTIYIFDSNTAQIVQVLQDSRDSATDVTWNPCKLEVVSGSSFGNLNVWAPKFEDNFHAVCPDFEEIEDNVSFEEPEDLFDLDHDSKRPKSINYMKFTYEKRPVPDLFAMPSISSPRLSSISPSHDEKPLFFIPLGSMQPQSTSL